MTSQIEWIKDASGETQRCRAMVVGWQNSLYSINQLIQSYNQLTIQEERPQSDPHAPMRIIAARRQVLASLLELKERLNEWIGYFNKAGVDCTSINSVRKVVRVASGLVENHTKSDFSLWGHCRTARSATRNIRCNLQISDAEINSVWQAMIEVGQAARNVALNCAWSNPEASCLAEAQSYPFEKLRIALLILSLAFGSIS